NNGIGVAGLAYGASIMPLKVLSARGSGSLGGIAQAIRWAADHGANVINMSLGGPMAAGTLASAVKYAHGKGVVIVAAAGNGGRAHRRPLRRGDRRCGGGAAQGARRPQRRGAGLGSGGGPAGPGAGAPAWDRRRQAGPGGSGGLPGGRFGPGSDLAGPRVVDA